MEQITALEYEITEEADAAMLKAGVKIPACDVFTGKKIPDFYDDAEWFNISTLWDCPDSPFGYCMYHNILDKAMDDCAFCHEPYERK